MTKFYDIFNGDADGICALQQLRLEQPRAAQLVTGVKRDISLLERVTAGRGDELTVLDISLRSNAAALARLLERGVRCSYFDHHAVGDIPQHPHLRAVIDTAPDVCTSLLVDRHLAGRQRLWAIVGAFGDNLIEPALRATHGLDLDHTELARLHELGECINYNAYGDSLEDLHYAPADLYLTISRYRDPRHFMYDEPVFEVLHHAQAEDFERAQEIAPERANAAHAVIILPDAAWSRRISGLMANRLAQQHPRRAHALLVWKAGGYNVSVRAPVAAPAGADTLCLGFPTGGGRQGAAGINFLPDDALGAFIAAFERAYPDA